RPWVDDDPATPNEAYFRHVDEALEIARRKGIVLGLLPCWGDLVLNRKLVTSGNARTYGRWLGTRYKDAPNVVWVLGGDQPPTGVEDVWRELAAGLAEGDGGRHLMTYHPRGGQRSSDYLHDEEWLDFNMMQSGHAIDIPNYDMVLSDYARTPVKPTLDGEPRYENIINRLRQEGPRITAHQVRKAAYNAVLSGACGHTYGCSEIYRFWRPGDGGRWGPETPWPEAMDFPGALHMGYLRALMLSRPWHELWPEPRLIAGGQGMRGTYVPAALAEDGSWALAYVPETQKVTVDLRRIVGGGARVSWYNPRDGHFTSVGDFPNDAPLSFAPPAGDPDPDYVLVVESSRPDTEPPAVDRVIAAGDPERVVVVLSEPVAGPEAAAPRSYRIDGGVDTREAAPSGDGRFVFLKTSPLEEDRTYTLRVRGVTDRAGNAVKPRTAVEFTFASAGPAAGTALVAHYAFDEKQGTLVRDSAGVGEGLDLEIADPDAVEWIDGGLRVKASTTILSDGPAETLAQACRESSALTIEAWATPAALDQTGPARIVSLSKDTGSRNFTLGQTAGSYITRLRTTATSTNGIPELVSEPTAVGTELTHVVYTRLETGDARIYVNGVESALGFA
ncbi:MAG: DUF4038 domain-containing protein, partial [Armatimonadota bacterium]